MQIYRSAFLPDIRIPEHVRRRPQRIFNFPPNEFKPWHWFVLGKGQIYADSFTGKRIFKALVCRTRIVTAAGNPKSHLEIFEDVGIKIEPISESSSVLCRFFCLLFILIAQS